METQTKTTENFITKNRKALLVIGALIVLSKLSGGSGDNEYAGAESSYASASSSSSRQSLDPQVAGRWVYEQHTTTTGSASYASFTSVKYHDFNEDGTYVFTDGGSSLSAPAGELGRGTWHTEGRVIVMVRNGQNFRVPYQFSDGQLVMGSGGDYYHMHR
ncbi:MAG: hypothetical protein IPM95_04885 [Sphingobacteriales bacterium]|nr:hypothetical protein [Sphingobacteriales bacterium]